MHEGKRKTYIDDEIQKKKASIIDTILRSEWGFDLKEPQELP
jgi:hypothetical protein